MSLQIDSHVSTPVALASNKTGSVNPSPAHTSSTPVQGAHAPVDSVKLSLSAHIHLLKSQGQGAKAIAANLGVPASTVAAYFSAPVSSGSSQNAAAAKPNTPTADAVPLPQAPATPHYASGPVAVLSK